MNLTNDAYLILLHTKKATEQYYRDGDGWVKISTRGKRFEATAEQVLNHLLPALAGVKANVSVTVQHHETGRGRARAIAKARSVAAED